MGQIDKITKNDWRLIAEALDMLMLDWENQSHPDNERVEELHAIATERGYKK